MKKNAAFFLGILLVLVLGIGVFIMEQPYKPTSFEADGELFTATVENGSTMILTLFNSEKCKDWEIALAPEMFACDYSNEIENGMEFHIIALSEGKGEMAFQCVEEDGSIGKYILTLSISRHKKKYLQIDTMSFLDYESTLWK